MNDTDGYSINGHGPTAGKLIRLFLASAIVDSGGTLNISKRALSDFSDNLKTHRGFEIYASPGEDNDMELSIEWYS